MKIVEAIQRANAFVLQTTGVDGDPEVVRLVSGPGRKHWWMLYNAAIRFPREVAAGSTVDGGELMIQVDDETGDVAVKGEE